MRPLIGILLETFPNASEPFILDEILELERQGLNLHIFSLRHPPEQPQQTDMALVQAPVTYVPSLLPTFNRTKEKELIAAQVDLFQQDSGTYVQTLKRYLKRDEEDRVNEFLQGGYLARQMQKLGITHFHVHLSQVSSATAEIAQAFSGLSYSLTVHTKDSYHRDPAVLDHCMAKAEFVFTCSDYNRRHIASISTSRTPIHVAYHGIDAARFSPVPKPPQPAVPLIVSTGNFCEGTGFFYLIKACHLLKQNGLSFHCLIAGDGPLEDSMRQQIRELGLSQHITLVQNPDQEQLIDYYQQAELFVLPCLSTDDDHRDGIPQVLLKVMAMEIPVISTTILGISELVESYVNGILVPEKDALSLGQAMEMLLRQPNLKTNLGKIGRLMVLDKFGLSSNVGLIKCLLLNATQQQTIKFPTQVTLLRHLNERHIA